MIAHARKPESRRPPSALVRARRLVAARLLPAEEGRERASSRAVRVAWLAAGLAALAAALYLAHQAGWLG
jgi:hypothetical protein